MLGESTTRQLKKLELPHGEIVYSTFSSISELSVYLANLPIHMTHITNLDMQNLCDKNDMLSNSYKNNDKMPNTYNIPQKTDFRSKFILPNSNPQISDHDTNKTNIPESTLHQIMASRAITTAIRDLLGTIDLDHVQEELAKEFCKKITALSFSSLPKWIEVSSMDLPTLRDTLVTYKQQNDDNIVLIEKEGEEDPQDMTYKEAMILDDAFDIAHLYYASILTLRKMANEVVKAYSIEVDTNELKSMTRAQLICKIYEFLYLVLEHQGLAKGGIVVCPAIDEEEKSISPLQTNLNTTKKQRVHSPANSTTNLDVEKKLKKMLALSIELRKLQSQKHDH